MRNVALLFVLVISHTALKAQCDSLSTDIIVYNGFEFCEGDSIELTSSPGLQYMWNTGDTTNTIQISQPGDYFITLLVNDTCVIQSDIVHIVMNPIPSIVSIEDIIVCTNQPVYVPAFLSSEGSTTNFTWTNSNTSIGLSDAGFGNVPLFTSNNLGAETETAHIEVVSEAMGCTSESSFDITVRPRPIINEIINVVTCSGEEIEFEDVSINLVATFNLQWEISEFGIPIQSGMGQLPNLSFSSVVQEPRMLNVSLLADVNGCFSDTQDFYITVNQLPINNQLGDLSVCEEETIEIIFNDESAIIITWYNSNETIGIEPFGNGNLLNQTISGNLNESASSTINYSVHNQYGCESEILNFDIEVNLIPEFQPLEDITLCAGGYFEELIFQPDHIIEGLNWSWISEQDNIGNDQTGNSDVIPGFITTNNTNTELYSQITVTSQNGECSYQEELVIYVNPTPSIDTLTLENTFCSGDEIEYNLENNSNGIIPNGTIYDWTSQNINLDVNDLNITGDENIYVGVVNNQTYDIGNISLNITPYTDYCFGNSINLDINILQRPELIVSANDTICVGEIAQLYVADLFGNQELLYQWSPLEKLDFPYGSLITTSPTETSVFTVTTIDPVSGCIASDSIQITVYSQPFAEITYESDLTFCAGEFVSLNVISEIDEITIWNNGSSSNVLDVYESGYYSCVISNEYCSSSSNSIYVNVTPTPIANIFYFDDLTLCEGESVALFSSEGTEWHWSNGQVGGELIVDSVETVSVFVIDEYGCQSANSEEINVEYFDAPNTSVLYSSPLEFCDGEDVLLSVTSTPEYEYSWNGQSSNQITITESGEYTCQISNTYCNFQSDLITVIVFDNPTATIYYNSALTFCEGGEVVLSSNQNSIWHWSNNQVGGDLIINENALVSVIIEDDNGCFSESSEEISIEVYDNPEINIESFPNSICSGDSTTIVASGAYAYYWDSFNEDFIQVNDSTIICFPNFNASYQLLIENQYGCSGIMDFEIEVFEVPIIEFDDDIQVCQDSPIEIDLSSLGGSTNWSGIYDLIDSNYLEFTPNESGYLIAVNTNENNCSATDSINVHVLAIDPISIIGSLPPCANSSNQEYIAMPNNYIYDWTIVNGDISIENGNQIIINWHETGSPEIYVGGTDPDNYCSTSLFIETNFNGISPEIVEIQQLFIGSNTLIISDNFDITNWGYDTPEGESIYFNECSGQYCEFNYLNLSTYSYWAEYGNDLSCLTTSYFNPLSNIVESDLLCQIFPSPFTTNLNIEVEKELFYTIELYSIVGDIIKRVEGISKGFSLETFHLARGTYIIKVFNNNQIIHIQKVIKQ